MKKNLAMHITALTLLTALAVPIQLAAQNKQDHPHQPHHYQLIDIGTFGGPQSYLVGTGIPRPGTDINNSGVLTGFADTSTPDPFPASCFNPDCFVSYAFQWQNGEMTNLGALVSGWSSVPVGISASGLIAGFSQNGGIDPLTGLPELHAVLWQNGGITDLGTLPEGGYESAANAVNSRGQVAGYAMNTIPDSNSLTIFINYMPPSTQVRAFLWDEKNGMQDLGTLGGTDALAALINEPGQVMGWSYTSTTQSGSCSPFALGSFIWEKEKGMTNVGSLGGTCTVAEDLNNRGQIVGYSLLTGDTFEHAFLSQDGSIQDLGGSLGGDYTGADAVNDAGQVVGWAYLAGNTLFHATLWTKVGEITDLGTVYTHGCAYASDVNKKGQVVGGSMSHSGCLNGGDSTRAFLWEDGAIFDLNTLIPHGSALHLLNANTINDRGEIAGTGADASGNEHAFMLIPCDGNHPGVEGCDYGLVDAAETAREIPAPAMHGPMTTAWRSPKLHGPSKDIRRMLPRPASSVSYTRPE
jgi:probable HAF family extracellular repeat protein